MIENAFVPHLILLLIVIAWARIENRHTATSRGVASMILGCLLFGFGFVNASPFDKLLTWSIIAVGLFIALVGTARFVAWQIKNTT
jgi:threonine/homoserine efflux transporter RhtA